MNKKRYTIIDLILIFIIIGVLMSLTSCKEDDMECECLLEVMIFDNQQTYYISGVPSDCNGNYDLKGRKIPNGHIVIGLKECK